MVAATAWGFATPPPQRYLLVARGVRVAIWIYDFRAPVNLESVIGWGLEPKHRFWL
jgi:hypothetical protein